MRSPSTDPTLTRASGHPRRVRAAAAATVAAVLLSPLGASECERDQSAGNGGGDSGQSQPRRTTRPPRAQQPPPPAPEGCVREVNWDQPDGHRDNLDGWDRTAYGRALSAAAEQVFKGASPRSQFTSARFNLVTACPGANADDFLRTMRYAGTGGIDKRGRGIVIDAAACGTMWMAGVTNQNTKGIEIAFEKALAGKDPESLRAGDMCDGTVGRVLRDGTPIVFPMPKSEGVTYQAAPAPRDGGVPFPMDGGGPSPEQPTGLLPDNARVHPANIGGLAIAA
jgi:hypothetical protein